MISNLLGVGVANSKSPLAPSTAMEFNLEDEEEDRLNDGRTKRNVGFMPSIGE